MEDYRNSFKYMLKTEIIFGISRTWTFNDGNFGKKLFFAAFWLLSTLSIAFFIEGFLPYYDDIYTGLVIWVSSSLTIGNTFLAILWGCATSKKFEGLLLYLSQTHKYLKRYRAYVRKCSNLNAAVTIVLLACIALNVVGSSMLVITRLKMGPLEIPLQFHWMNIVSMATLIRGGIEHMLYYCILKSLSVQLEFIAVDAKHITNKPLRTAADRDKYDKSLGNLCFAYNNACECCHLINAVFSVPISASFGLTVLYHIGIAYELTTQSVIMGMELYQWSLYALLLFPNIVALLTVAVAGQCVHSNADGIMRAMAHLLHITTAEEESYHAVKRAVRAVCERPLRVVIFGSTQIGMALLPTSLAFFATYYVIALQFKNVV